jgi:hypothetical protein
MIEVQEEIYRTGRTVGRKIRLGNFEEREIGLGELWEER